MRNDEFKLLLAMLDRLKVEQKQRLEAALATNDDEAAVVELLESRLGPKPTCPHCHAEDAKSWGKIRGLQRDRRGGCNKTFNCLTNTPLARLRKKAQWLRFAVCQSDSAVIVKVVVRCFHAACLISGVAVWRSGLSQTGPTGCQLRVFPDHRSGFDAFASA